MRVSVIKNDPGYIEWAYGYEVHLDGVKLMNCFTADEEHGEAHCYKTDANGRPFRNGSIEILKGKVEIIKPKDINHGS